MSPWEGTTSPGCGHLSPSPQPWADGTSTTIRASHLPLRTVCEVGRAGCVCRRPILAPAAVASVDREQSVVATTGAWTTSPAPDSLCSPRNIRQRDSDEESPRKSRRTTRRACSPHAQMPRLSWCCLRQSRLKIRMPSFTIASQPSCRCQFGWRDYGGIMLLFQLSCRFRLILRGKWVRRARLMMSNLQVLGQFVTSLNRMSSEVMRLAFG